MALFVTYILGALSLSFLCSMLEAVLLSVTPAYAAQLEQEGSEFGPVLREMKADVDRPLAAILSLNTVSHTIGATGAGAQAIVLWGNTAAVATSILLTLAILIAAEIVPKTLGARYFRELTPFTVRTLEVLIFVQKPLIWLSNFIGRALKPKDAEADTVSRHELAALAQLGKEQGVFDERESRIIKNLFSLSDLITRDLMTPRTVMFALPVVTTVRQFVDRRDAMQFSRVPVYRATNVDDVVGYVLKDDVYLAAAKDEHQRTLGELARPHLVVPDTLPVPQLFETLLSKREHIALVVDEYGGVAGVVTMEDVLETLLGMQIIDEADKVQSLREMARAKWRERAKRLGMQIMDEDPREDRRVSSRPPPTVG
ncbi:MAG: hemolysin family protein [Polyangiales bacterium]